MTKSWIWCCPVYLLNVTCIRDKAALACTWWISFPTRGEISRESESQISIRGQLCSNLQGGGQILILSSLARCFATHSEGVGCISLWNSLYVLTQGTVIMTTDERLQKKTNCTLLTQASFSALFLQSRGRGEVTKLLFSLVLPGFHSYFTDFQGLLLLTSKDLFQLVVINTWIFKSKQIEPHDTFFKKNNLPPNPEAAESRVNLVSDCRLKE